MRESPAQRYEMGQDGTRGEAGHPANNPKVVGSNPTPATNEDAGQAPLLGVGPSAFRADLLPGLLPDGGRTPTTGLGRGRRVGLRTRGYSHDLGVQRRVKTADRDGWGDLRAGRPKVVVSCRGGRARVVLSRTGAPFSEGGRPPHASLPGGDGQGPLTCAPSDVGDPGSPSGPVDWHTWVVD